MQREKSDSPQTAHSDNKQASLQTPCMSNECKAGPPYPRGRAEWCLLHISTHFDCPDCEDEEREGRDETKARGSEGEEGGEPQLCPACWLSISAQHPPNWLVEHWNHGLLRTVRAVAVERRTGRVKKCFILSVPDLCTWSDGNVCDVEVSGEGTE